MVQIPLKQIPAQSFQVILDEQECEIRIYYRFGLTFLDLTVNGVPVCAGAVCRNGASIVQFPSTHFVGSLHFLDTFGAEKEPHYSQFDERFVLLYISEGEDLSDGLAF